MSSVRFGGLFLPRVLPLKFTKVKTSPDEELGERDSSSISAIYCCAALDRLFNTNWLLPSINEGAEIGYGTEDHLCKNHPVLAENC